MATSGSFDTGGYNGKHLTFSWYRSNTPNGASNYSDITWTLRGAGGSGWHMAGNFKVVIDGETVYSSSDRIKLYDGTTVASGTKRIYHNNDGNRSFSAYAEAGIYTYAVNATGSGSWALDKIPRYTSITSFSVANISGADGLTKVKFNWSASDNCDWAWYSKDNGASWSNLPSNNIVTGLSPNTNYNFKLRVRRTDSQLTTDSGTVNKSTYNIATLTSPAANFSLNNENSLTCKMSNPSGASVKYYVDLPNGTRRYTSAATTETSYTWTAAQILALLQYIPNANSSSIKVGVATLVNGNETYWNEKVGTLNVTNSNPTFSNFTYEDVNSKTIALTGNNQRIVKGYSNVRATVSTANKAVAKNYATMSKYRLVIGSSQVDVNYSSNANVQATINSVKNNIFTMYAIDSRGNSTPKQISPLGYIDYSPITLNKAEAVRADGIGSEVTLIFNGSIWEGSFGAVLNEIVSCTYKYKETTSNTWINGATILNPTRNGKTFSFSGLVKGDLGANGFNINKSYDIQVIITDKLTTATYNYVLGSGKPGIAITKDGIAINGMYDESLKGALQVWNGDLYVKGVKIN